MSIAISAKGEMGIDTLDLEVAQIDQRGIWFTDWRKGIVSLVRKLSLVQECLSIGDSIRSYASGRTIPLRTYIVRWVENVR